MATTTAWRKSSHSGGGGGNGLEVSAGHHRPKLAFRSEAWSAFVENLKNG